MIAAASDGETRAALMVAEQHDGTLTGHRSWAITIAASGREVLHRPGQAEVGSASNCEDYIKICEPPASQPWTGHEFFRYVNAQAGPRVDTKKYKAHHILCVGAVTDNVLGDSKIHDVIVQTDWCISNKENMIAMPLWGHTVKWYCSVAADSKAGDDVFNQAAAVPPFANLPQHDFDHPGPR